MRQFTIMKTLRIVLAALAILAVAALLASNSPGTGPLFDFWFSLMGLTNHSGPVALF
jgi:hypothetical protein